MPEPVRSLTCDDAVEMICRWCDGSGDRHVGLELEWLTVRTDGSQPSWDELRAAGASVEPFPAGSQLTFEPGGQAEVSTPPLAGVDACIAAAASDAAHLERVFTEHGLGLLAVGGPTGDRQRLIDTFYPEGSQVADYFTPCIIENACEGEPFHEFDVEAAKALLADAGLADGFDTTIKLRDVFRVYLPEPTAVAEDIRAQLAANLGINATVEVMESGAFLEENATGLQEGIHLLGWGADYPHVTNFLDFHFGGNNPQFGDIHPDIIAALTEGARTVDPAAAQPIYEGANNLIREHVPMLPVAWGAAADAALTTLENAAVAPVGAPQFFSMNPGDADLVFVQNAEPISLFCADETDGESLSACEQVLEGLYGYGPNGEVIPKLATECVADDAGLVWTCTLRDGVLFHDGSTLDANDVVTSWSVGLDASNPLHIGNTGTFEYFSYLWGALMNAE